ncbi:hypothetical protein G6F35_016508 [Rhizopus arrhizus]|nr:hypothetical protein G6F35_016508 [Rhizopus arrhizus]
MERLPRPPAREDRAGAGAAAAHARTRIDPSQAGRRPATGRGGHRPAGTGARPRHRQVRRPYGIPLASPNLRRQDISHETDNRSHGRAARRFAVRIPWPRTGRRPISPGRNRRHDRRVFGARRPRHGHRGQDGGRGLRRQGAGPPHRSPVRGLPEQG